MNEAVAFSIETKREIIAFDIVQFSREFRFSIVVADKELQLLIKNQSYELIEDLVHANSMLLINYDDLDAMEKLGQILANDRNAAKGGTNSIIEEDPEQEDEGDDAMHNKEGGSQESELRLEGGGGITTSPHKLSRNPTFRPTNSSSSGPAAGAGQAATAAVEQLIEEAGRNAQELNQLNTQITMERGEALRQSKLQ